MEITRILTCSIGHMTQEESQRFTDGEPVVDVEVMTGKYGYMFYVGQEDGPPEGDISEGLRGAIAYARAQDCQFLRFDQAYEPIEGVPTYDW
jgi:hypothetical protein